MYGQEIQEGEECDADLLGPAVAQDLHQADQAAVWSEQIPNALDHLWQRPGDRLLPGVPGSPLNGLHSEARREACRETDAEHRRVSSGSHCERTGCLREAQEKES